MRRSFTKRYPDRECPIKASIAEYSAEDRGFLIAGVESALRLADSTNDAAFDRWHERRFTDASQT